MPAIGERVAIYTRLSKDLDGTQTATARQEADARSFASLRGWEVAGVFCDVDLSAYRKGVTRPAYEALLAALGAGELDGVLVWKLDRLVRRPAEFERFWGACEEAGAFLASVNDSIDTSHASGRALVRILVAFAGLESDTMSLRIKAVKEELAKAGRPKHGGPRAYGLTRDWSAVVPEEAERVRDAARRVLAGESLRSVVLGWNAAGAYSTRGKPWSVQALRHLLLQRRLCGEREHRGVVVAKGTWPPILDAATSARLRAVLEDPSRRPPPPARTNLLTGFLRCGACGGRMWTSLTASGKRRYACPPKPAGCGRVSVLADPTDEVVAEMVLVALDGPEVAAALAAAATAAEEDRHGGDDADVGAVVADEALLVGLARDFAEGRIGRAEWMAAREVVEARLAAARTRLVPPPRRAGASLRDVAGEGGALREAWAATPLERRRAVVATVLEHVEVAPAVRGRNRFDGERLRPVWRY